MNNGLCGNKSINRMSSRLWDSSTNRVECRNSNKIVINNRICNS